MAKALLYRAVELQGCFVPICDIAPRERGKAAIAASVASGLLYCRSMTTELRKAVWRGVDGRSVAVPERKVPRQRIEAKTAPNSSNDAPQPDESIQSTSDRPAQPPDAARGPDRPS
jgi:hypothetical protein